MLHQFLKEKTKSAHDELERLMFVNEIMNGILSVQQYRQILVSNYIIHKSFEDHLFNHLSAALAMRLDISHRRKLQALKADMHEMKTVEPDSQIPLPPELDNNASILGALYVLEGATLGGSVIVKRLQSSPQFNSLGLKFNYYQVYGNNLIPYWKNFCAILDEQPESSFPEALEGAQTLFNCIANVQQQNNQSGV